MQWSELPVPTRGGPWQDNLDNITTGPRPLRLPNPFLAESSSRRSSSGSHNCPHQGPSGTARPKIKWDLATKTWISAYEDVNVGVSDGAGLSRNTSHASSDSRKRKRGGHDDNHGTPHEAKKDDGEGDGDGGDGGKGGDSIDLSKNF